MGAVIGNVEALKNEILKQAQDEASRTRERAQRVAERDMAYANEEAEEIKAQQRAKIAPVAEFEAKKNLVDAEMIARKRLLEKREELVSRIFAEAEDALEKMRGSKAYLDIVTGLIKEGVDGINGDAIIEFGENDKKIFTPKARSSIESQVKEALGKDFQLQFKFAGDSISAGVVVKSKNGKLVIDNSFSSLIRRLKENLRGEVSEMLLRE